MTEPVSSAMVANIVYTSAVGAGIVILGVDIGLDFPTLIAGVVGGATAMTYREEAKLPTRAFEIITAALLSGYAAAGASFIIAGAINHIPFINAEIDSKSIHLPVSWAIGYLAHGVLLPGFRKLVKLKIRRLEE